MIPETYRNYFAGKKITVMGLGLLGRGVGDAQFLAECGAELIVTDLKTSEQLADSVVQLKQYSNITFILGEHRNEDFQNRDMILVAASVPMTSPYLQVARDAGVELAMSGALFAQLSGIPIIGTTGTRGKSTVTYMIYHALSQLTTHNIILGGNIRGVSNLQLLQDVTDDSVAVMELDSWQLQGFGWAKLSPHVAIFTNIMPDHLNYYKGDVEAYFRDKANIFLYQKPDDVFITTPQLFQEVEQFITREGVTLAQDVQLVDSSLLPEDLELQVPGEHNRTNAALANVALQALGLSEIESCNALATYQSAPGRLEFLREVDGVKIYNDNNATTPAATLAGLEAVGSENKNVILIMGGANKDIDMSELLKQLPMYCKEVILLPGTGTDMLPEGTGMLVSSLEAAVTQAKEKATEGDVILFSPAFASFGLFTNEYDRNDQFVGLVNAL